PVAAGERVTQAAVWRPPPGFIADFHGLCERLRGAVFADCFVRAMAKAGAPAAALAFARSRMGEAYLEGLDEEGRGPVALAHVAYPFRANENSAWVFVNAIPDWIDVDDFASLPRAALAATAAYRAIRTRYPRVMLWPGGRGRAGPEREASPRGGVRFIVSYRLQDFCHACAIVGHARFAFAFDRRGKFLGARLLAVTGK
ncbi:MAG TPA: hypothetical protein VGR91_10510, partial [Stellaceae bacterium]|nr:hypothetical protein [Stellaceae bacterium]